MTENHKGSTSAVACGFALALAVISFGIAAFLLVHLQSAHAAAVTSHETLMDYRTAMTRSALSRPILPENVPLTVCNQGAQPAELLGVVSSFRDPGTSAMRTFNSSSFGNHSWQLPPHSRQTLRLEQDGATVWDGSTVFFALELRRDGKDSLQTGDASRVSDGCAAVIPG